MASQIGTGGFQDIWESLKSAAQRKIEGIPKTVKNYALREANKVQASFYKKLGSVADTVDINVAQPLVKGRDKVVGGLQTIAETTKSVATPFNFKLILIVLLVGAVAWLFSQFNRAVGK